ncbi:ABC transporter substrate-binding protein [Pseudoroseicyclus sp. CLL3-39]|uniref:ABC transporter substrate-binding protein n=2 Tax=Pseudoroseicyclus tamaricis TaxID=2705421 RepID=A0A6B2JNY4_9RHOB|nr:ABC transporter substrate-binding protein [Pseudoroseicyclus tamaricis]
MATEEAAGEAEFRVPEGATLSERDGVQTIITHGYSNFGDLALPADFEHLPYVNPDAPKGGEISIWAQGTFDNLNPYATKEGRPGALSTIGFESILQGTADEVGASYCYLCTTMEYPADFDERDWVIFNLRDDVTFSDGEPMTAEDIVFSHNISIEQGTVSFASVVSQMIPEVEALDDYTVRFRFGEDFSPNNTISQAGTVLARPQHWYEETGARLDESSFEIPPGTGAYELDSYDINQQIIYTKVDDWWGEDIPFNRGRDNYDTIRVEYFADTTAAFEAFKAGEFTFRQENSSLNWATSYDFPALENDWVVREELPDGSLPNATGFIFNMESGKFEDRRVRQALALMYNFTWTNDTLQYGLFQQRESFWEGSDFEAEGVPEGRELELLETVADMIDPSILTDEVTMPHTSGESQLDRRNLGQALTLLEEAGYVVENGVMMTPEGEPFTVEFLFYSPAFDRILIPYVDNLRALGIDASYERIDDSNYTERLETYDYDMTFASYNVGLEEGESLGQRFGSDGQGDVFNPANYANPAVDALIPYVANASSREEMAAGVRAIDRIMRYDMWMVPVWYLGKHWVAYYDFYRHPEELPPYALGQLDFWWIDEAAYDNLRAEGAFR